MNMTKTDDGWALALRAVERSRTHQRRASPDLWEWCADIIREHATPRMVLDILTSAAVLAGIWWLTGMVPR